MLRVYVVKQSSTGFCRIQQDSALEGLLRQCAGFGRVRRILQGAQDSAGCAGAPQTVRRARRVRRVRRIRQGARARRSSVLSTIQNSPTCVGLLKEPQKFQIQFLELHVDFYIVDDTELRRARAHGSADTVRLARFG